MDKEGDIDVAVMKNIKEWKDFATEYVLGIKMLEKIENVDRYVVFGIIGEGGYGTAYLGVQNNPNSMLYVLKKCKNEEVFENECRIMESLNFSNYFIHSFEEIEEENIIVEIFGGNSLSNLLEKWKVINNFDLFIHIGYSLLKGIKDAHAHDIFVGDIKPSNIVLLTEEGLIRDAEEDWNFSSCPVVVRMCDVGCSVEMDDYSNTKGQISTLRYGAYESSFGLSVKKQADISSFGLILCRMLSGKSIIEHNDFENSWEEIKKWYDEKNNINNENKIETENDDENRNSGKKDSRKKDSPNKENCGVYVKEKINNDFDSYKEEKKEKEDLEEKNLNFATNELKKLLEANLNDVKIKNNLLKDKRIDEVLKLIVGCICPDVKKRFTLKEIFDNYLFNNYKKNNDEISSSYDTCTTNIMKKFSNFIIKKKVDVNVDNVKNSKNYLKKIFDEGVNIMNKIDEDNKLFDVLLFENSLISPIPRNSESFMEPFLQYALCYDIENVIKEVSSILSLIVPVYGKTMDERTITSLFSNFFNNHSNITCNNQANVKGKRIDILFPGKGIPIYMEFKMSSKNKSGFSLFNFLFILLLKTKTKRM
jgi:serine/threonine protein kinase